MDSAHKWTDRRLAAMEKRLSAIYGRANEEVTEKINDYLKSFLTLDKLKRESVASGKISEEEYKRWKRTQIFIGKNWRDTREAIAKEYLNVNKTALAYINGELPEVYAKNYNAFEGTANAAAKEYGAEDYSFTLTDANTVKKLSTENKTLLPYKVVDGKADVRWNTKKINAEVLQSILQGESVGGLAKRLETVTEMNHAAAVRNARTMITSAECAGRQASYVRAEADGMIIDREWIAANDGRTRYAHRELNGKTAAVNEPFKVEGREIMYPGDPHAHPRLVYNCRCTIAAVVKGFGEASRARKLSVADNTEFSLRSKSNTENSSKVQEQDLISEKKNDIIKEKSDTAVSGLLGSDAFSPEAKSKLLRGEMINNGNRYETAYIYDSDGNIKFKVKGSANEVKFTSAQIKEMKGCVITHNHPGNSCFSSDDIFMLKKTGAAEIRASTGYGTYVLQKPKKWSQEIGTYEKIDTVYNSYVDDYIYKYKDIAAQEGKHLLFYLEKAEEEATRAFAKDYGLIFKMEKYNG